MLACHEDTSGWSTNCGARVKAGKFHSLLCHLIKTGSLNQFLTKAAQIAIAEIIGHDKD
jgi:hypothetical protein